MTQALAPIRAFIFDLDGVITDTAEYHYLAWQRLADEQGIPFSREENEAMKGLSRRASLDRLLKGRAIEEAAAQDWMTRKNEYYLSYLTQISSSDLLPGVDALLISAQAMGLKLGIASASRNAALVLERLGILNRFEALGDGSSVSRSKPAPDIFVWTAGRLGVPPSASVIFEDSEAGIIGAIEGGFHAIGLGKPETLARAHVVLPSLDGMTAELVLQRLSSAS